MKNKTSLVSWIICIIGAIFYCYEYFLRILPSVITADLMRTFDISAATLGHLIAFYYYAYTPMQLPVGVLMDRFNTKHLLSFACLCCSIGTYLFAMTENFHAAGLGRFLVGFGSAFAFVGVMKLATIWLPPERFALVSGLTTTLGMLGAMFGIVLLSHLVEETGWQGSAKISMLFGLFLTVIIYFFISNKQETDRNLKYELNNSATFSILCKGFIKVLTNSQIWINGIIGALLFSSLSVFAETWGVAYLEQAHSCSSIDSAKAVSMVFLGWAVGSPIVGWVSDSLKRRIFPMLSGAILACICISIVLFIPSLPLPIVFLALFLYGFCCSVEVVVFAIGRENCPELLSGTAIAVTNMLVMSGGTVLQPLVGILLDLNWTGMLNGGIRYYSVSEYRIALSILPIGLVLSVFLLFYLKETNARIKKIK